MTIALIILSYLIKIIKSFLQEWYGKIDKNMEFVKMSIGFSQLSPVIARNILTREKRATFYTSCAHTGDVAIRPPEALKHSEI